MCKKCVLPIDKYTFFVYNNECKGGCDMKKKDLVRLLEQKGWWKKRSGGNHDIYTNGKECETIPRHNEIAEELAKMIIRRRGLR